MEQVLEILQRPIRAETNFVTVIASGVLLASYCAVKWYFRPKTDKNNSTEYDNIGKLKYKAVVRSFNSFFREILPKEFQYETAQSAYPKRVLENHPLCALLGFSFSDKIGDWVRVMVKTLAILSTNVVLAVLYYPAPSACSHIIGKSDCVATTSAEVLGHLCYWDGDESSCKDASANELFIFVVGVVVAVSVVASVTDKFMAFALSHARLAVEGRRMAWLYCCCFRAPPAEPGTRKVVVVGRSARVVPAAAKTGDAADEDLEHGTDASFEGTGVVRVKPGAPREQRRSLVQRLASLMRLTRPSVQAPLQAPTLRELLRTEESELQHFGDEWTALHVQSRKATMMRAARFSVMKASIDYVSAAEELNRMLKHSRERYLWMETPDKPLRRSNCWDALWKAFRLRQLRWFDLGDPVTALELMHLAHLEHPGLIEEKLRRNRARATALRTALVRLPDGEAQDRYLMQAFLTESLCGHKRVVARAVMFEADEVTAARKLRVIWQYFALLTVPAYFLAALAIIFYASLLVSARASVLWLACVILNLLFEYLYLQPLVIWLLHVWMPGTAKKDVLALHWVLQVRAQRLLRRRQGLMHSVNALVQHFHPACRAARLLPHLPVARLLLSLSDYDLPFNAVLQRPRRRHVVYPTAQVLETGSPLLSDFCEAVSVNAYSGWRYAYNVVRSCFMPLLRLSLHGLFLLPPWAREVAVETMCTGSLLGLLVLIYHANNWDPSGALTGVIVAATVLGLSLAGYKIYRDVRKEMKVLGKLRMQREVYSLNCNAVA